MAQELDLLTVDEVAQLWAVSSKTVRRLLAAGDLPTVRVGPAGRSVRVRRADAADYLARRIGPLTAENGRQVPGLDPEGSGPEPDHRDAPGFDSSAGGTP